MKKRVVFCTMMDTQFLDGYKVFFKSLLTFNPNFNYPFLILDNGLDEEDKKIMEGIYSSISFLPIPKADYHFPSQKTESRLRATYYKLEIFRIIVEDPDIDRLIFVDMDILIKGSLQPLVEVDLQGLPIGACQIYQKRSDSLLKDINSGVVVLDKDYLTMEDYENLVGMAKEGFELPDQDIINRYFIDKDLCHYLPKIYNVEKRMVTSKALQDIYQNAVCLHFVARKPWEEPSKSERTFKPAYEEWYQYYE